MIDSRKLDREITIERQTATVDDFGTPTETWAPIATIAAQRLSNGSREFLRSYGTAEEGEAVFRVRFVAGLAVSDRIVFEGVAHNLVEVIELGRRAGLDLRVKVQR